MTTTHHLFFDEKTGRAQQWRDGGCFAKKARAESIRDRDLNVLAPGFEPAIWISFEARGQKREAVEQFARDNPVSFSLVWYDAAGNRGERVVFRNGEVVEVEPFDYQGGYRHVYGEDDPYFDGSPLIHTDRIVGQDGDTVYILADHDDLMVRPAASSNLH
ncbi:hypothetical protein [Falsiroseomonas sp. HW251]|uniref:hypothetical protein n=1 Tax=Falsiroseomonas sp. HW251 TaxID=3390998 RepID=UPI003D320687